MEHIGLEGARCSVQHMHQRTVLGVPVLRAQSGRISVVSGEKSAAKSCLPAVFVPAGLRLPQRPGLVCIWRWGGGVRTPHHAGMPRARALGSPTSRVSVFPVKIERLECLLVKMWLVWMGHERSKAHAAQSLALSRDLCGSHPWTRDGSRLFLQIPIVPRCCHGVEQGDDKSGKRPK